MPLANRPRSDCVSRACRILPGVLVLVLGIGLWPREGMAQTHEELELYVALNVCAAAAMSCLVYAGLEALRPLPSAQPLQAKQEAVQVKPCHDAVGVELHDIGVAVLDVAGLAEL